MGQQFSHLLKRGEPLIACICGSLHQLHCNGCLFKTPPTLPPPLLTATCELLPQDLLNINSLPLQRLFPRIDRNSFNIFKHSRSVPHSTGHAARRHHHLYRHGVADSAPLGFAWGDWQEYVDTFSSNRVRLETLQDMGHEDLQALGIASYGDRRSILVALQNYMRSYFQAYLRCCDMASAGAARQAPA